VSINPDDASILAQHNFPVVRLPVVPTVSNTDLVQGHILQKAISRTGAISICCLLIFNLLLQVLAQLQASSRFVFALARDNAMPLSETIRRTNKRKIPTIAHWLVIGLCAPFACLPLGSETTLYSLLAVTASTLSYIGYVRERYSTRLRSWG
jgi:amino acid transporter